jgi:predicted nucleic acid-binding protein
MSKSITSSLSSSISQSTQKILFFDAGPIITLVMSRLIWILPELKKQMNGRFYITPAVKKELIERPLTVKRFEFEALQVAKLIRDGVLEVYEKVPGDKVNELITLANSSFSINGKNMDIIQSGEMESVACALQEQASSVVMDERTLRLFIESNKEMKKLLEIRFQKEVTPNSTNMNLFSNALKDITIIRSVELLAVAYKLKLLDTFIPPQKDGKQVLLDAVLWSAKYNGCAITGNEIDELKQFLLK